MIDTDIANDEYLQIDPNEGFYAYLEREGWYGAGAENPATVELTNVIVLKQGSPDAAGKGPFNDRDCLVDSYTQFVFRVVREGKAMVMARSRPQSHAAYSGSNRAKWLMQLGLLSQGAGGLAMSDITKALPLECCIQVKKPREDKNEPGKWYTGDVVNVRSK